MLGFPRRAARASLTLLLLTGACAHLPGGAAPRMPRLVQPGDRVLILGDSITFAGGYVDHVEACLLSRYPDLRFEVVNLGLPSETVSGLSEEGHAGGAFPRPDLHDRLDRVLDTVQPDVVFACYGINCGIYRSLSEERFAAYRRGVLRLVEAAAQRGARVALMTPPPYALPAEERNRLETELGDAARDRVPFPGYDDVMARYSEWILQLPQEREDVVLAADVRSAILPFRDLAYGQDPVHPNGFGHLLWSKAVLEALGVPELVDRAEVDAAAGKVLDGRVRNLEGRDGMVSFEWTTRVPLKTPDLPGDAPQPVRAAALRFNRHRLIVKGLPAGRYEFWEGENRLCEVRAGDLAAGLDLTDPKAPSGLAALMTNERAEALLIQVGKRRELDFSLLQRIGHERPMPGKPLSEEEALSKSEARRLMLEELRQPVTLRLRLSPVRDEQP